MFKMKLSRQLLIFLLLANVAAIFMAVQLTYDFSRFSSQGTELAKNLQLTFLLNQELHQGIVRQIYLLHKQFEDPDADYPQRLNETNFKLGQGLMAYLKLDLGEQERFAVEKIRAMNAELAVQSLHIYGELQSGQRDLAETHASWVYVLETSIDDQFGILNSFQVQMLQSMLMRSNQTVRRAYVGIYIFAGLFIILLLMFVYLVRRHILQPLNSIIEATDRIRRGDFTFRITSNRNDELGRLAYDFNFMAQSLAESYAGLEHKVEERTRQVRDLRQQFVQTAKMSAMGQLVGGVAHELNNPLTVILGFTELEKMRMTAAQEDPKKVKMMEDIHYQAERCRRIVANLLQMARREEPHWEAVHINELIDQVLHLREYEFTTRNIHLVRYFDPTNPVIRADPHKIQQVVLNILNNAADAIQEFKHDGLIQIRTLRRNNAVVLEFTDNGTGIQELEKIFDPFYTTKEVGKGTGLGLSVCYGIVEEHGGDIRAENLEQGARFIVTLPIGDLPSLEDKKCEPASPSRPGPGPKRAVLIVDDEESLVELQMAFLTNLGLEGHGAHTGEEAIHFLQNHPCDLVVSDVRMPGQVDGIQLFQWLEENRPELTKHFLFISGDVVAMNTGQLPSLARVASLQKPFQFDTYSQAVMKLLGS